MYENNNLKVSVALTVYNGAEYLQQQLDSFIEQQRRPDELVIADDGSSDGSPAIIEAFSRLASFPVYLHQNSANLGYAQNFSKALSLTSGDIVFLSDQDDVWQKEKIARVVSEFEVNPRIQLVIHDLSFCDESLQPIGQTKLERLKSLGASEQSYVTGMATAVRSDFLKACLPIPDNKLITHDLWLHECAQAIHAKKVIPDVLALYRRHEANATADKKINVSKKTGLKDFVYSATVLDTKQKLSRKLAVLSELTEWLGNNQEFFSAAGLSPEFIEKAITDTKINYGYALKRLDLLNDSFFPRLIGAVQLYTVGGYKNFLGLKSMFKDILIR